MLLSESTTRMELTPELAHHWLENLAYRGNRSVSPVDVARMIRTHLADRFPETEAIHCTVDRADNRNLDSQHRCQMVIDTGKPLLLNLKQFDAPDEQSRRSLWKTLDRGRGRKYGQAIHADEWSEAGYRSKSDMQLVGSTLELIENGFTLASTHMRNVASFEERTDFAFHWATAARVIFDAIIGCPNPYRERIRRKLVFAVMLAFCNGSEQNGADAERLQQMSALIKSVAFNANLEPKSAGHRLLLELERASGTNPKGRDAIEFMRRIAYCCARHLEGKHVREIPSGLYVALPCVNCAIG